MPCPTWAGRGTRTSSASGATGPVGASILPAGWWACELALKQAFTEGIFGRYGGAQGERAAMAAGVQVGRTPTQVAELVKATLG